MVLFGCGYRVSPMSQIQGLRRNRTKSLLLVFVLITTYGCAWFWTADPDYIPPAPEEQLGPKCFQNPEDSRCWDIWDGKLGKDRKNAK